MAIGTLALCYNNVEVFRGVVKMRRGKLLIMRLGKLLIMDIGFLASGLLNM